LKLIEKRLDAESAAADKPEITESTGSVADYWFELLAGDPPEERRRLRWGLTLAVIAHLILLAVTLPELKKVREYPKQAGRVYVVQQVRFQSPPPAPAAAPATTKPKTKKIPIPDPTPDDPEPIETFEIAVPDVPIQALQDVFFGIPTGTEGTGKAAGQQGQGDYEGDIYDIRAGIVPPVNIAKPDPPYTEEARRARIEGVVILTGVIDEQGRVRNLQVIKGLALGLTEKALEVVAKDFRYKPATLDGKNVAVRYHITINFNLQ
jgi:TonB family protein